MSGKDGPPLDDDIRLLVERTRGVSAASATTKARVLAHVESIVLPPGGGHTSSGGDMSGGGTDTLGRPMPGRGHEPGSTVAPRNGWMRRMAAGALLLTLGGAAGVVATLAALRSPALIARGSSPTPSGVPIERPIPTPPPREDNTADWAEPAKSPPESPKPMPVNAASYVAPTPPPTRAGVSEERVLLDVARSALESEDWPKALAVTKEHERRFPSGLLVQEREVMAVRALAMMGHAQEASARASRFREHFPDSLLLPALESFVENGSATDKSERANPSSR